MPKGQPPPELHDFLRQPNPAVVATVRPDGQLHTAPTWYEWTADGTVLLNMDGSRRRLEHMRSDSRAAVTVLDASTWYRHISLIGNVETIRRDATLEDIDRIAQRYTGQPYLDRSRDSWTAVVRVERWHGWESSDGAPGGPLPLASPFGSGGS